MHQSAPTARGFAALALLVAAAATPAASAPAAEDDSLSLATFSADVSPPLRKRACVGFIQEFTSIEHPLLAKGIVLRDARGLYVICALDYCGLCNDSYDMFRKQIANAAGTDVSRVALQALHQHTAPVFDADAARILYADEPQKLREGLEAAEAAAGEIARAVRQAAGRTRPVTHVAAGKAKVDRVASNRRVPQPDGSIVVRYSAAAGNRELREAPEGLIDPWLRTVTFYDGQKPVVRLHYYATHPQSRSGPRVTYDVPGIARERLERETEVPQVYFTGCGGNVAMGKYNDGSDEARDALTQRMLAGMQAAVADCDRSPRQAVDGIDWRTRQIAFPLRRDVEFSLKAARAVAQDERTAFPERLRKAMLAAWIERVQAGRPVELSGWSAGNVDVVHLPGEPFVQFQLAAQQVHPKRFACVAGYGECAPWYIGEDRIYQDRGGYEQTWSFVGPCEELMHATIGELLGREQPEED